MNTRILKCLLICNTSAIDLFMHFILQFNFKYYFLLCCWSPNCLRYQIDNDKYEIKPVVFHPETAEDYAKYIFKCLTKSLKFKVCGH